MDRKPRKRKSNKQSNKRKLPAQFTLSLTHTLTRIASSVRFLLSRSSQNNGVFPAKCQVFHLDILQNFHFYRRTNPIPPPLEPSHRAYLYTSPSSVMPYDSVNEHRNFVNLTSPSDVVSTF